MENFKDHSQLEFQLNPVSYTHLAIAAAAGVDFLCYVTPSEHLGLPGPDEVREGVVASKIAAHAGDIAKGVKGAMEWDREMSIARKELDWDKQCELSIDPCLLYTSRCV